MGMIGKIVGNHQEQRSSLDNTKLVIKLAEGDNNNYVELIPYTEYTQAQILVELQKNKKSRD